MLPVEYRKMLYEASKLALQRCHFPEEYYTTKMVVILKKGDPLLIKNRRYLNVGRMSQQYLMKIVSASLLSYVEKVGFICEGQFGFRSKRGTDLAVATTLYKIATINAKSAITLTALDLSSAFFCVTYKNLESLFRKIIHEDSLQFFLNLLKQRKSVLHHKGKKTEPFDTPLCGTAQGEPTSPIFFIMIMSACLRYALDQRSNNPSEGVSGGMFADDMMLLAWSHNMADLLSRTSKIVGKTAEYAVNCGFKINNSKSEIVVFGNNQLRKQFPKYYDSPVGPIKRKSEVNMLGIRFDENLSFKPQTKHILQRLDWHCVNIHRLKNLGIKKHILRVLFSVAFGTFNSGIGIISPQADSFYDEAQRKINFTIRKILNIKLGENNKHMAQNVMLRLTDVFPFHLQHKRMGLLTLNRVVKNKAPAALFEAINNHLEIPAGWPSATDDCKTIWEINDVGPKIKIQTDQTMMANPSMLKKVFPMNMSNWFNDLPSYIRVKLGTEEFDKLVINHIKLQCFHPIKKDPLKCNFCKDDIEHNLDMEELVKKIRLNYNHKNHSDLENQLIEDFSLLSNLLSMWIIKILLEQDVIIDNQNWSEEESFETNSDNSSIFLYSECQ